MLLSLSLGLWLTASFPLPAIDGKPLAVKPDQKTFRLPMRFEKARAFYAEQLGSSADVTQRESSADGRRVLTLTAKGKSASWTKAVIREGEVETVVEVTPVLRLEAEQISGNGKPLVEFIFGRSPEVQKAVESIDHTEQLRAK